MTAKRRWHFSIRAAIVAIALLSVVFAWLGSEYRRHIAEIRMVEECGGNINDQKYCGPPFLEPLLGRWRIFYRATDVSINDGSREADWDKFFGTLVHLENLSISSTSMDCNCLQEIHHCENLSVLLIGGTDFTEECVPLIVRCKKLQVLSIESIDLGRKSIELLAELPRIDALHLVDCTFDNPDDLALLLESKSLTMLDLRWSNVDDSEETVRQLKKTRPDVTIFY